jgi:hypothetical protein
MRRNHQHLHLRANSSVQDVVRKAGNPEFSDTRRKLNTIPIRRLANRVHRSIKRSQITSSQAYLAGFVVSHMLKMLQAGIFMKKITHLSNALAWRPTSCAEMR